VVVAGVVTYLHLVGGKSGSLRAEFFVRDVERALAIAGRLESAGLRPNVVRSGPNYTVYIAMANLLRLAEKDEGLRKAIALYLAEKAKNGAPRQREVAEKILKRHPSFSLPTLTASSKSTIAKRVRDSPRRILRRVYPLNPESSVHKSKVLLLDYSQGRGTA
jgi:hypothetical protein